MADFYWAPSGHPFRVELRFTTSASPSQEGSALFATDFPRYTRSRWTKKDRDRLGDRFVDESSRCVVPGELLQPLQSRHGNERALNVVVQLGLWRWVSPMMRKKPILCCSTPHRKELFKSVSTERRSSLRIALYRCADVAYGNAHFQDIFSLTRGASAVLKDFADGLRGFLSGKNHILHQFQDSRRMPIDNVTCRSGFKP